MGISVEEYRKLIAKSNGGKSAASEHDLQVSCVNWFRLMYPDYAKLLFAIPNGGYRTPTTARYMKAEGQQSGCPDLFLAIANKDYFGFWIEMKNGKAGRVSDAQKDMMERLKAQGYKCEVIRDFDTFVKLTNEYMHG